MPKFRIDEQVAKVTEYSYDVEAPSEDEVENYLDRDKDIVHWETISRHVEITNIESID